MPFKIPVKEQEVVFEHVFFLKISLYSSLTFQPINYGYKRELGLESNISKN